MDPRALTVLEFSKIRDRLAERAAFAASRELALALEPSAGRRAIETGLRETAEARLMFELQPDFSVRAAHDVRPAAGRARVGTLLDAAVLQEVRDTLESAQYVRGVLNRLADRLPLLAGRAETLDPCPELLRAIKDSIGERGQILDTASPALGRVRAQLRTAYNRLMDALQRILDSSVTRTMLQEALITVRAGRYVIPVRAEARNQFRGIVHDESSSGQTVFMEPLATVALNNEWRHLQLEEEKEVERVLLHLSGLVAEFADRIVYDVDALAAIDLALAKAKYALSLRATAPRLEDGYRINLIEARHPLLTGAVVPIDVRLGTPPAGAAVAACNGATTSGTDRETPAPAEDKAFIALVITGPNTGGKTVALKTVGLLQLMAQAGLHLPVAEGSSVAVFDQIFADIGDEQSIEQSLSTFSSHMSNIVRILGRADGRSLVLLDELGAGTDPEEGSALARAILSHLVDRGVRTVATTHYSELKAYAYGTPGVQNASVEFDVETLRPTYRLIIGLPGRSNALAIAQRLGLPEPILAGAREMVRPEEAQIEDLLAGIQAERDAAQAARREVSALEAAAREAAVEAERRLDALEDERVAVLEAARREAAAELEAARQQIRRAEGRVAAAGGDRMEVLRTAREVQQAAEELTAQPVPRQRRPARPAPAEE
ncbi:MAG TPA: endonuclease MutS2, partial [Chloroflexota bacterium]|nr:endonuclease MutS2 [Chloroflexota bacterium]